MTIEKDKKRCSKCKQEKLKKEFYKESAKDAIPYSELVRESRLAVKAAGEKRHHELIGEQIEIVRAKMGVKKGNKSLDTSKVEKIML